MYTLKEKTKMNIQRHTGINFEDIPSMDVFEIESSIEEKIGRKLKLPKLQDGRLASRGSVYLFLRRLIGINCIDRKISRI